MQDEQTGHRSRGTPAESMCCICSTGHEAAVHRSTMNEQKHVILKVGLQPTACHKQEMLGKDNKQDFPQGVRSAGGASYSTSLVQAPREAGNSPLDSPLLGCGPTSRNRGREEVGCLLLQLPGELNGAPIGAGVVGHALCPKRLHVS